MDNEEALNLVKKLDVSDEKRQWIEQYALFHVEAEKNPIPEIQPIIKDKVDSFEHFEVHDVMKGIWKTRNKNVY
jgi:hypothetical protein